MMKVKVLLALLAVYCTNIFGSELIGRFSAEQPVWQGVNIEGGVAPAYWDIAMRHPTASEITFIRFPQNIHSLDLVNGDQKIENLKVSLTGMQFKLSEGCEVSDDSTKLRKNGEAITVEPAVIGDKVICSQTKTPFTHSRPIVSFEDLDWKMIFNTKEEGEYIGRFSDILIYDYVREGVTIRHHVPFPITIKIEYRKEQSFKITINNPEANQMTPVYFLDSVSGKTTYQLHAEWSDGKLFDSNISMELRSTPNCVERYCLDNKQSEQENSQIPFSVNCVDCKNGLIIDIHGIPTLNKPTISSPDFDIQVEFKEKPLNELEDGYYKGNFSLMFAIADGF